METVIHTMVLLTLAGIALAPVFMVRGIAAIAAWLVWVTFWGTLASLTAAGVFVFDPQILRLVTHFGSQVLVGIGLFVLVPAVREAVRSIPLEALVGWQIARVFGGFFLIGAAMGEVSVPFALIAGTGDIIVGIAAARTVAAMKSGGDRLTLARRHTALGLADFVLAISTAVATSAVIKAPYILIPLFVVPIAVLAHLAVLDRRGAQPEVGAGRPEAPGQRG